MAFTEPRNINVKHIFLDIVEYTLRRSVEAQTEIIAKLNEIVKTAVVQSNIQEDNVIYIPTGDGMCISLLNTHDPFDVHLELGLIIFALLRNYNSQITREIEAAVDKEIQYVKKMRSFSLRISINENVDNLIIDINGNKNISGHGINMAARILSLCKPGRILVADSVYERLVQREKYIKSFDSFDGEIKHGFSIRVHQFRGSLNSSGQYDQEDAGINVQNLSSPTLTELQAHYILCCAKYKELIKAGQGSSADNRPLHVLIYMYSKEALTKPRLSISSFNIKNIVSRPPKDYLSYLSHLDETVLNELYGFICKDILTPMKDYFEEPYLNVFENSLQRIEKMFPKLIKLYQE